MLLLLLSVPLHLFLGEFKLTNHDFEDLEEFVEDQDDWVTGAETSSPVVVLMLLTRHEIIQLCNNVLQNRMVSLQLPVHLCKLCDDKFDRLTSFKITHFKALFQM